MIEQRKVWNTAGLRMPIVLQQNETVLPYSSFQNVSQYTSFILKARLNYVYTGFVLRWVVIIATVTFLLWRHTLLSIRLIHTLKHPRVRIDPYSRSQRAWAFSGKTEESDQTIFLNFWLRYCVILTLFGVILTQLPGHTYTQKWIRPHGTPIRVNCDPVVFILHRKI